VRTTIGENRSKRREARQERISSHCAGRDGCLPACRPAFASADPTRIIAKDDCESVSCNLAIGAGTCVGGGGTTFGNFIAQLVDHKFAGAWHFSPKQLNIDTGSSLVVTNRGGETHTFTEVTQFGGGGIVPALNLILFGTPAPPTFFFGPLTSLTRARRPPFRRRR
jgi:hypothetical protein